MQLPITRSRRRHINGRGRTALLVVGIVASALGTGYLLSSTGRVAAACATPPTNYGTVASTISVPSTGNYRIWSRMMAPDTTNNSYLLEVDGGTCYIVGDSGLVSKQWTWVDYQTGIAASKISVKLTAGTHTFKLIGREASVKVDRVLAVLDGTCPTGPTGMGDNCTLETDATAPTVSITAPNEGTTASGTINVIATAADAKGVTKLDFYVDNVLQATDTTAPYSYSWNTGSLANGSHNVTARAYDAAGNAGVDTRTITIRNGDTQAPSVPTKVTATALAANKVALSWTASTDDTAVTGYTVKRDGLVVANAVAGVNYTDGTVVPGTAYSYSVSAYDAKGNNSAASVAARVTTPSAPDTQSPSAPSNLTATVKSSSQINLSWTASTDDTAVAGYDVYRGTVGSEPAYFGTYASPTAGGLVTFGDANLKPSTKYTYYVIAKDAKGNASDKSASVSATTSANPVTPTTPTTPTPTPTTPSTPTTPVNTGVIRGKVTGGKKKAAITGVRVTAVANGKRYTATTNKSGVYRFDNLPAGRYQISYRVSGYEPGDETLRLKEGKNLIWNMWLVKKSERAQGRN